MVRKRVASWLHGLANRLHAPNERNHFGGGLTGAMPAEPAARLHVGEFIADRDTIAKSLRKTLDRLKDEKR